MASKRSRSRKDARSIGYAVVGLGHIAQTSRVMAKQYRDAIGPWRAYLPVMDR